MDFKILKTKAANSFHIAADDGQDQPLGPDQTPETMRRAFDTGSW
jgi:hypothetical protein